MTLTYAEIDAIYRMLKEAKDGPGAVLSRRDRAAMLIGVCIDLGFNTRTQIVKALRSNGLSADHVLSVLAEMEGPVQGIHLWDRSDDGVYFLIDAI